MTYEIMNSIKPDDKPAQHNYDCIDQTIDASSESEAIALAKGIVCRRALEAGYSVAITSTGDIYVMATDETPYTCFNFHAI